MDRWDRIRQEESKLREAMRKVSQVKRTKVVRQIDSISDRWTDRQTDRQMDRIRQEESKLREAMRKVSQVKRTKVR